MDSVRHQKGCDISMSIKIPHCFKCNKCGLEIEYEKALEVECGQCEAEWEAIYEDENEKGEWLNGEY